MAAQHLRLFSQRTNAISQGAACELTVPFADRSGQSKIERTAHTHFSSAVMACAEVYCYLLLDGLQARAYSWKVTHIV